MTIPSKLRAASSASAMVGEDSSDGEPSVPLITDQAVHQYLATLLAGERNPDSASNSYLTIRDECNLSIIGKTTAVTIGAGAANDTHLLAVHITTALVGTCVITGFADSDGTATDITIPAATPAGIYDFKGARNSAGALTVTCSNVADDNDVQILWRPI